MHLQSVAAVPDSSVLITWTEDGAYDPVLSCTFRALHAAWVTSYNKGLWYRRVSDGWTSYQVKSTSDRKQGGYIVWLAAGRATAPRSELRVQRVDSAGNFLLGDSGRVLIDSISTLSPTLEDMASDSAGFLYVLLTLNGKLSALKISPAGETVWRQDRIMHLPSETDTPTRERRWPTTYLTGGARRILAHDAGGCLVLWSEILSESQGEDIRQSKRIAAAAIDQEGRLYSDTLWQGNLVLCESDQAEFYSAVQTTSGDFVAVWGDAEKYDYRSKTIRAQRLRNPATLGNESQRSGVGQRK